MKLANDRWRHELSALDMAGFRRVKRKKATKTWNWREATYVREVNGCMLVALRDDGFTILESRRNLDRHHPKLVQ